MKKLIVVALIFAGCNHPSKETIKAQQTYDSIHNEVLKTQMELERAEQRQRDSIYNSIK